MTTHLPSPDEPSLSPTHVGEGPPELVSSQLFQPPSTTPSDQVEESFYTFEDEPFDLIGTPWVAPFELSNEIPSLSAQAQPSSQATAIPAAPDPIKQPGKKRLFSLPMIAIFVCVAILVGMLLRRAQVQFTPSPQPNPPGKALVREAKKINDPRKYGILQRLMIWRKKMELTEELKDLLIKTAKQLKGSARRLFQARTVKTLGPGGASRAERELGWSRKTIRKGMHELESGITCVDAFGSTHGICNEITSRNKRGEEKHTVCTYVSDNKRHSS